MKRQNGLFHTYYPLLSYDHQKTKLCLFPLHSSFWYINRKNNVFNYSSQVICDQSNTKYVCLLVLLFNSVYLGFGVGRMKV